MQEHSSLTRRNASENNTFAIIHLQLSLAANQKCQLKTAEKEKIWLLYPTQSPTGTKALPNTSELRLSKSF